ncbi:protein kinase [Marinicella sp. S1101]|uniref:serine/threonine-protein kinase n=1 Tax=Marinicella marina TaxID=2996016 RepID=UPI002260F82A|nr:serine/threonine-protein kinase [Marinicella marina]MCX7553392.1 protein kinase [Marinicella marina]MDJ1140015.1 protein kinase [Marinicella marina]
MDQAPFLSCPQCHHHNPIDTKACELCEWKLVAADDETLKTQAPSSVDLNQTIDPNAITQENHDPQVTVAPAVLAAKKQQASDEKTFHLAGDLSHFEVLKVLGQGGMGMVYHAKDRTLQRDVALKMLRPLSGTNQLSTEALLDEARMASQLNHPNIVTIYDVARADNSNYIVMEWVDGKPLDELIPEEGLPLVTAIDYARQIAHGLSSAHQKYIIHRDIKPQNIMLSEQNTLKILDFGIAGLVEHMVEQDEAASKAAHLTTPAAGTPSYMSPEQAQGLNLDPRSDIYSLGIVLYQMLTGQRPFTGKNSSVVKQAIINGRFTPIEKIKPELPAVVVETVNKMLATAKDQRWQSSAELATALDEVYNELTYSKNWWQKRHWLTKAAMLLPFIVALGWTTKDILFPASTQQLIEQQLAEATKVAILPFDNISGDPTLQLFGDGLAVNLSTDLATVASEIGDTWIVPATEISRMKEVAPKAVADKYGVELILTGSMQHMGSTRLVVLNLLDAQSGQQLKTTELNINADDLFGGHALIREKAMALLDWPLPEALATSFNAERPQLDGAYKHYVEGRGYLYRYDQDGNLTDAINSFKQAIKNDPSYEAAYVGLAETYLNQFSKTKASTWLDQMVETITALKKVNVENPQVSYLSAEAESNLGNYEQAIDMYTTSIKQNPNNFDAQIGLANAFNKLQRVDEAENTYLNAIKQAPNNWNVIVNLGVFYTQIGKYSNALKQFLKLTEISPNNHIGYRNVAALYYIMNDITNAITFSEKAIAIKPSDRSYSNLGTMLFSIEQYEEAIHNYLKAIETNDKHYIYWGNLADAYKFNGNQKSAINSFQKASELAHDMLNINPNDVKVKADLSYYLSNLNFTQEALDFASEINENSTGLENFIVATAFDELGMIDQALLHLEWALKKNYPLEEIVKSPLLKNSKLNNNFRELISSY